MLLRVKRIEKETLVEKAYGAIRALFLKEQVNSGESLCIDDLARQLDVSITPIREALARLQSEGLIDLPPRKQPVVRGLSKDELRTLYEIRGLLEPYFMGMLATLATKCTDVRVELESLLRSLHEGLRNDFPTGMQLTTIKVDHRLGEILLAASGNFLLEKMLQLINNHILRLRLASAHSPAASRAANLNEVTREHCALIEAILAGDKERINRSIAEHLKRSYARSCAAIEYVSQTE